MLEKIKLYQVLMVIVVVIPLFGFSNNDLPLSKDDQKNLEKSINLNKDAQKLLDKSNALYSEIAELDSKGSSDDKVNKLKDKALNYQLEALEIQKEANFLEYKVLSGVMPEIKASYSAKNTIPIELNLIEEEAKELFYKAEKSRNEALQLSDDDKDEQLIKLTQAQEFEKSGISKQRQLIDIYTGKQAFKSDVQSVNSDAEDAFVINEDLLKAYLDYVNSEDSIIPIESFRQQIYSGNFTASNIRSTWDDYIYTEVEEEELAEVDETSEVVAENVIVKDVVETEITKVTEEETETNRREVEQTTIDEYKVYPGIIFKVQIAADKKQLSQHTLQRIYAGNKTVKMLNEEGWYKYSIGDFGTFSEADKFRISVGVNDAFVVAYKDGEKVDLLALLNETKNKPQSKTEKSVSQSISGLIYKVQIAAAKGVLSESILNNIYNGAEAVDVIKENGWNKYSIGKYSTYKQALETKQLANVEGSFIVAYKDGVKVSLGKTKRAGSNKQESIAFKVQIAADMQPLSTDRLHEIYSGFEKINKFEEDGWFKYSIGEFKSFEEAREFMKTCGVKGSFIVAFKGSEKMNVLEAKKLTRCIDPVINKDWISENTSVQFKVQIAASSRELNIKELKRICCIEPVIYVINEDEWFKYSIGSFKDFNKAVRLKNISGVGDAFIVAYKNGKKVNVKDVK